MRTSRPTLISTFPRRGGFSVRTVLVLFVVLAALASMGYVFLAPMSAEGTPFTFRILTSLLGNDDEAVAEAPAVEEDAESGASLEEGAVEVTEYTGEDDSLISLLGSNIADEESAAQVARSLAAVIKQSGKKTFSPTTTLAPDTRCSITMDGKGKFLRTTVELDPSNVFHAVSENGIIRSWKEEVVLDFKPEVVTIRMDNTFIDSVLKAGETKELAGELGNKVFKWDIDFQSESFKGDICRVLVERRYADDRPSGYGRVLCAVYDGKKTGRKTAVLFNGTYYDEKGQELKKESLRSPLGITLRVTSKFGQRFHPIYKRWKHHDGVDYAAPRGTPVWAIASGTVTFAGWGNGYGNYVCVRHDNGTESRYGHLHRFYVRKGQRVKQKDRIGLVGTTGDATGPHLHFEFRTAKGKLADPLTLQAKMTASVKTVAAPLKGRFEQVAQERLRMLDTQIASTEAIERAGVRLR
ncbi:MAG: M23 family metallopeptidase [Desulfomonile sp.]|nr:M23 family metallopeptidase [Desulfomonile sp.]